MSSCAANKSIHFSHFTYFTNYITAKHPHFGAKLVENWILNRLESVSFLQSVDQFEKNIVIVFKSTFNLCNEINLHPEHIFYVLIVNEILEKRRKELKAYILLEITIHKIKFWCISSPEVFFFFYDYRRS